MTKKIHIASTVALLLVLIISRFENPMLWVPLTVINLACTVLLVYEKIKKGKSDVSKKYILWIGIFFALALASVFLS